MLSIQCSACSAPVVANKSELKVKQLKSPQREAVRAEPYGFYPPRQVFYDNLDFVCTAPDITAGEG